VGSTIPVVSEIDGASLPLLWALPFVGMLASIALFPLLAPRAWEHHQGKITALLAACLLLPMFVLLGPTAAIGSLAHTLLLDYVPFILLLVALFAVSSGIVVRGNLHGAPWVNVVFLGVGTVLASFIGTTGASMVMIRPLMRANDDRKHSAHTVIFFIFLVSNIGGSLTPLGDPPLFLGFLRGIDFFWPTQHLFLPTMLAVSIVLAVFAVVDTVLYRREGHLARDPTPDAPLRVEGLLNMVLIGAIVAVVLLSASAELGHVDLLGVELPVAGILRDVALVAIAVVSVTGTPEANHRMNGFTWEPMKEVARLFAGIFITMIPVMAMLRAGLDGSFRSLLGLIVGPDGAPNDMAFFWLTGLLSSFLDNAPTYLVFFELGGGDPVHLMAAGATTLAAISAGAVFMGANTYIGNAPNFMVYAIARNGGVRMPGFFGYMTWSGLVLLPTFLVVSLVFFR
jgi:Na+/H+ antiporter NhaD/arsenite permease-like protein